MKKQSRHLNPHANRSSSRREFIKVSTAAALGGVLASNAPAAKTSPAAAKRAVKAFYDTLSDDQKNEICFEWDHRVDIKFGRKPLHRPDPDGVLLRAHVSNAWLVTPHLIGSDAYSDEQRVLIRGILDAILSPGWPEKLAQQAEDDTGQSWGGRQALAIFGTPGTKRWQCVITGFHLTLRTGSDPDSNTAFGGAISHGHQPSGFYEEVGHPGNVFWYQAKLANKVYQMLDDKQRKEALFTGPVPYFLPPGVTDPRLLSPPGRRRIDRSLIRPDSPRDDTREPEIRFRPADAIPGLSIADMSPDQKQAVWKTLDGVLEPYRDEYREQVHACLKKQGGLEACRLVFYKEQDMGNDGEWDNWRLEGPSFVWYFRGAPHVHIWIHVAENANAPVSSYFG